MTSEQQSATVTYVIGDPLGDVDLGGALRRRLHGWTFGDHRRWSTFAMLWLAVASVPACCDDYESAERQSVLWAERAAAMVKR